ncbi:hypothetical protein ASG11_00145 [Sphingomonas sp. Leaf357]|uniref:hypothetical protein n=1 Tax=Sphingomonas sp. Leaf357 TaxID=1736350 RepID=UPI0006FB78CA|nr:hypothetical protein [Sphingomonas sp. Leaf357]KQS02879.1 hypothetical protein ASG11_00145 [Sphingomonas sp. Leaf357]
MTEIEQAERSGRIRARVVIASAAIFLATFAFSQDGGRSVDIVRMLAWAIWSATLLLILAGGGAWARPMGVRRLMNDEVTRANRQSSLAVGFWVAMGTAAVLFVADRYEPFPAQEAARMILTFGIAAALLRFGLLERRAYSA